MALVTETIEDNFTFLLFCDIYEHKFIGSHQEAAVSTRIEDMQDKTLLTISIQYTRLRSMVLSTYEILSFCV
jgi:hypothetical protein